LTHRGVEDAEAMLTQGRGDALNADGVDVLGPCAKR
jgi:hypothetical protein